MLLSTSMGEVRGASLAPDSLKRAQTDSLLALGAGKLSVVAPTQEQIRKFVKFNPMLDNGAAPAKYAQQPRLKAPFMQGQLSPDFVQRGLNALNVMRYIAGIGANVELNGEQAEICQVAALLCAISKTATGEPKPPVGMEKDVHKQALQVLSKSVVATGSESLDRATALELVPDAGKDAMGDVCRRRQLLNPALRQVAFGQVGKFGVINTAGFMPEVPVSHGIVAWPAQNTPLDYFDISVPLSLMFSDDYDIKGNVILVMVRLHDGKVWKFGRLLPKQDGYYSTSTARCGLPSCIVWKPNLDQYRTSDQFSVHVSGVKFRGLALPTIEYTISFFDLFTVFVNGYLSVMEPISTIASNQYQGNTAITSVDIASSVQTIEPSAFAGCIGIERVKLPESLAGIASSSFKGCVGLKSIDLPNTVLAIDDEAFAGCSGIARLGISYKLQRVGKAAFKGCVSMSGVDLPESLQEIGANAFADCAALAQVAIPPNVSKIGTGAFSGCTALRRADFAPSSGATALELSAHAFQGCIALDSINIPGLVPAIEEFTFDGCTSLKVIRIAEGVQRISDNAFLKTPLERIYIPASVVSIGRVSAIPSTAVIYCKKGSYAEKWAKELFRRYELVP